MSKHGVVILFFNYIYKVDERGQMRSLDITMSAWSELTGTVLKLKTSQNVPHVKEVPRLQQKKIATASTPVREEHGGYSGHRLTQNGQLVMGQRADIYFHRLVQFIERGVLLYK